MIPLLSIEGKSLIVALITRRFIIGIVPLVMFAFLFWYFFIDTLALSELIQGDVGPKARILVNLFDFDTGLTRYDIYNLKRKSSYWEKRMQDVLSIKDPRVRQIEHEKLVAEMMEDPSMKKVIKKTLSFGIAPVLAVLRAISRF